MIDFWSSFLPLHEEIKLFQNIIFAMILSLSICIEIFYIYFVLIQVLNNCIEKCNLFSLENCLMSKIHVIL